MKAKAVAEEWLKGMGLEMKPSKTRITHTLKAVDGPAGFDFLGFNIRQYPRGKTRCTTNGLGEATGFAPSIRPSPQSQERLQQKVRDILRSNQATRQATLIAKLSPILRGWGNYFSSVVSKEVFRKMDHLIFWKLWPWAVRRHPNKPRKWVADQYWTRDGHGWTFGTRGIAALPRLAHIPIRRYVKVKGNRSPFDGDAIYWSTRTGKHPELPWGYPRLLKAQKGMCPTCGLYFKPGDVLRKIQPIKGRFVQMPGPTMLVHEHCAEVALMQWCDLTTHHLAEEPDEGKLSRPVLKTSMGGDAHA
jgi:RNA-directed DNA polymerase